MSEIRSRFTITMDGLYCDNKDRDIGKLELLDLAPRYAAAVAAPFSKHDRARVQLSVETMSGDGTWECIHTMDVPASQAKKYPFYTVSDEES